KVSRRRVTDPSVPDGTVTGPQSLGLYHEKMLKSCRKLSMTVKSPNLHLQPPAERPPAHQGGPWILRQTYSWMDRQGRPVSPPLEYAQATPPEKGTTRKVELSIEPGQSLGLMIRGGVEYNLGIFITGVDKDSVADRAGLMIGDQILEVNGQSFLDVTHDEAVNQLKFHKRMTLTVRDVGKVPHSCTAYDDLQTWESHSPGRAAPRKPRSPALQMVEEKARVVLKKSEFTTLAYYQEEYAARQMTIEAFVAVLLELLNTPEKYTLLTELREVVLPEDRARFDELVYRREAEGQRCREFRDMLDQREQERHGHPVTRDRSKTILINVGKDRIRLHNNQPINEPEDYRTPSEDSGVGLGPSDLATCHRVPRTSDLALSNDEDYDAAQQDYGAVSPDGEGRSRRHSSPGDSRRGSGVQDANMFLLQSH
ncbi:hypothetical protein L9F63_017398, partial [Diploptera punctata]